MADIQYLNYGDLQIELLALLNNLANNVQSYVESQSWSKSRKEKFMSAYQDIMNRGLLGASNASGLWVLNVGGDDFGFDNMDRKSREMYQEAAYFIQQQMSSLPTKASLEEDEEKKKKELPLFDNKYFTTNFLNQLSKDWFGGRPFDTQGDWNSLDARGENGRRGRKVRADRLARSLETYVNSLDETKLNFEGSPFSDLNDFKTRVNEAVAALRTESPDDDLDALNRIGLRASDYFNDGSGDIYGTDREGNSITYGQYYDAQSKLQEEERQAKLKAEQDAFNLKRGVILPIGGIHGTDARTNPEGYQKFIAETYGTGQAGYNKINEVILSLLNKGLGMTASDKKLLGNFLYYIRQNNPAYQNSGVSNEEYAELMKHNSLKGKRQLDFIRFPWKVNGLDIYGDNLGNIYYVKNDRTSSNGVIENPRLKFDREKVNQYKKQFLQGLTNNSYLNTPDGGVENEWSSADIKEASAIVADIASIVDPEPWSAATLGLVGSGLRHAALLEQPEITSGDAWYLAWDYASSLIGAIPLLGDAAIATKTLKSVAKLGERLLKYAGRAGATASIFMNAEGSYDALKKAVNGLPLTPGDWKALGRLFQGVAAHGRMNLSNALTKKILTSRGVELANPNTGNKFTLFLLHNWRAPRAKELTGSVKVKTNTGEVEIRGIKLEDVSALEKEFIKAGNNQLKKVEKLKENKGFIEAAKKQGVKTTDITDVVTNTSWRNAASQSHSWLRVPTWLGTTGNTFKMSPVRSNPDNFENYVRSLPKWQRASTRGLDWMLRKAGWYDNTTISPAQLRSNNFYPTDENLKVVRELENAFNAPQHKLSRATKIPVTPESDLGISKILGKLLDGNSYEVVYTSSNSKHSTSGVEEFVLKIPGRSPERILGATLNEMKQNLGKRLKEINNEIYSSLSVGFKANDLKWKDFVKSIKDLKRKGFLYKQGGKLTDTDILNFLKYYK